MFPSLSRRLVSQWKWNKTQVTQRSREEKQLGCQAARSSGDSALVRCAIFAWFPVSLHVSHCQVGWLRGPTHRAVQEFNDKCESGLGRLTFVVKGAQPFQKPCSPRVFGVENFSNFRTVHTLNYITLQATFRGLGQHPENKCTDQPAGIQGDSLSEQMKMWIDSCEFRFQHPVSYLKTLSVQGFWGFVETWRRIEGAPAVRSEAGQLQWRAWNQEAKGVKRHKHKINKSKLWKFSLQENKFYNSVWWPMFIRLTEVIIIFFRL